ncbi:MAG: hypothetical protein K2N90_03505 [Lachnospiraceae bacterium]|nr:hypothetical protein [Lachnospiraceae bacterium]
MKKQYAASRSGLFLIELILSIFFFIIAAAVVMQLFVKSHFISEDTININYALLHTQNISEIFLAADGDFDAVEQAFSPEILTEKEGITAVLYFDKDWQRQTTQASAAYMITLDYDIITDSGSFASLKIYVNECPDQWDASSFENHYKTDCIHQQEIKKYLGGHRNG